jgi:hypothetical protein
VSIADSRVSLLLALFAFWLGWKRGLRRWAVRLRLIGPG